MEGINVCWEINGGVEKAGELAIYIVCKGEEGRGGHGDMQIGRKSGKDNVPDKKRRERGSSSPFNATPDPFGLTGTSLIRTTRGHPPQPRVASGNPPR